VGAAEALYQARVSLGALEFREEDGLKGAVGGVKVLVDDKVIESSTALELSFGLPQAALDNRFAIRGTGAKTGFQAG
jgi:hypothetical protein